MKMHFAIAFFMLPFLAHAELTEVTICFALSDDGTKIGDGQCENAFGDEICDEILEAETNNGWSNAMVDKKCYDDMCLRNGCLKKCLMCCQDPMYNCSNVASETTCSALKGCGACDRDALTGMMVKNCPKTCGYCELRGKPLPEKCNDKESQCERLQNLLSCNTEFMRNNCAKTCNVPCTASNATTTTRTTTESSTTTTTTVSFRCVEDWVLFSETKKFFKVFAEPKNFDQAIAACQSEGGSLALPTSEAESEFIAHDVRCGNADLWAWIGARKGADGKFHSHSGDVVNFTKWDVNQPDGDGDCAHLWNYDTWNDAPCSNAYSFACEKPSAGK